MKLRGKLQKINKNMLSLKLVNYSINTARSSVRSISNGTNRLLGFFDKKESKEEPEEPMIAAENEIFSTPHAEKARIERLRNKSGLLRQHRRMLHGEIPPYRVAESWVHNTLKYKRKIYGKYGSNSNLDPRICFYTDQELAIQKEFNEKSRPFSIQEMLEKAQNEKKAAHDKIMKKEEEIARNLTKLNSWIAEMNEKKQKKENDARAAKERKDRLIEEVRRHFGFELDSRDERFKEMLAIKEKEQKKAMKETKRKDREQKLISKLAEANADGKKDTENPEKEKE